MILIVAAIALLTAAAPVQTPDLTDYLAGQDHAAIQEDIRQAAKTACQAEADGPQLALVLACARAAPRQTPPAERTASAR